MSSKKPYQLLAINEKTHDYYSKNYYCTNISWFVIVTCCILSLFLLMLIPSVFFNNDRCLTPYVVIDDQMQSGGASYDCEGKFVYVLDLPSEFNVGLIENCSVLSPFTEACKLLTNSGLGLRLNTSDETVFSGSNWFDTDQFSLEVIFHNRMKQYRCLTNDSLKANAIFVPYYSGLDLGRYLFNLNATLRDETSLKLVKYLLQKPEWKRFGGRDHFLIAGRVTWDFTRKSENTSTSEGWGNRLLYLPEIKNMTSLLLEASPTSKSESGIPYPTYFHPSSGKEVERLQVKMREKTRPYLFSLAGAPRPNDKDSVRNVIIDHCLASKGKNCNFLHIKSDVKPENIMKLFQMSDFCLQPPGDTLTRKSTFDAITAGCIPVFFHPGSAYIHYTWHLPKDYPSYSVFIPIDELIKGKLSIEKILLEIPKEKIIAMRKEVIKLIPRIVYANPSSKEDGFEDAFEVAVKGVLDTVKQVKMEIQAGENATSKNVVPDELAWKYKFFGDLDNHEWDKFFGYRLGK